MTSYKKVAILGAGAVGAYVLWGLAPKKEIETILIAEGERKERLEREGIMINDQIYHPQICTPEEAKGADLIIVAVKYTALDSACDALERAVDKHTTVMSLLNGVDSEETISRVVPEEQILYSLIKISSERIGNHIRFNGPSTMGLIFGELDPSGPSDRIDALVELFKDTEIHYRITDVILNEQWSKFLLNCSYNLLQAIIGCGVGSYTDSRHMAFMQDRLRDEVLAVAKAKGVDLGISDVSSLLPTKTLARARYSTLQDIDAKRHTEIDMFSGAVVRMGKEEGIPTPYNEYTYHLIKALEEKNDGLFDYE